jgi:hypothetical protein
MAEDLDETNDAEAPGAVGQQRAARAPAVTRTAADRLARKGLLSTAVGALLLLYTPWAKFWQGVNFVGSLVGVVLTVWGIACLYRGRTARHRPE